MGQPLFGHRRREQNQEAHAQSATLRDKAKEVSDLVSVLREVPNAH